jgi:ABC-type phosphate transport system substrate-binding protein
MNLKISKSIICVIMATIFVVSLFSAIPAQAQTALISPGHLYVLGSSTVYPVSLQAVTDFQNYVSTMGGSFTATTVHLNDLGSGAGFTALTSLPPTTDIAASSTAGAGRGLYTTTSLTNPQEFIVGYDSIAIVVPESNTWLSQGSASQVADLFRTTGNGNNVPLYATWGAWANAQVPPVSLPSGVAGQTIGRIGRDYSSGTFDGFNVFFLQPFGYNMAYNTGTGQPAGQWLPSNYQALTSNGDVMAEMRKPQNQYAIGFVGLGFVQDDLGSSHPDGVIPLKLYNPTTATYISPSVANVKGGLYVNDQPAPAVILRPLCYFMDGIPSATSSAAVKSLWISWIKAHDEYLERDGYITMNRIDFAGAPSGNNGATGTKTIPDGKVDFADVVYFADAWIAYYSSNNLLNPYADISGPNGLPDGKIDFHDVVAFADHWIRS